MRYTILIGLLAAVTLPAWAEIPLDVAEVVQNGQLVRDGRATALGPRQPLKEGDVIKTGDWRSSVILHFVQDGVLTLGRNSQLLIDGASPSSHGRGEVLRAQLLRGELTLEAYPAHNMVPKDYRLNVGPFQVRALGADLWAYIDGESETVCLHQGALEITSNTGEQRLDFAGDCLQRRGDAPPRVLPGGETELRDRLLSVEQSPANAVSAPPVMSAAPARAEIMVKAPEPTSVPAPVLAKTTVPAPSPVARKIVDRTPHWVIVLATARSRAAAEDTAYKLAKRTLRTTVRETGKAPQPFSVTFGEFETRKEAEQFAKKLRSKYRLKIIRIAVVS